MRDYNAATSTFNDFFGPMMMVAHNAMLEAWDLYEESGKKHIIRPMKRALQQFDRFRALRHSRFALNDLQRRGFNVVLPVQAHRYRRGILPAVVDRRAGLRCDDKRAVSDRDVKRVADLRRDVGFPVLCREAHLCGIQFIAEPVFHCRRDGNGCCRQSAVDSFACMTD